MCEGYVFTCVCLSAGGGVSAPGEMSAGSPGLHLGVGGLQAHTWGGVSQDALRQPTPPTATAAGGTHPTGMHSCFRIKLTRFNLTNLIYHQFKIRIIERQI